MNSIPYIGDGTISIYYPVINNIYISDVKSKSQETTVIINLTNKIPDIKARKVLSGWNNRKNQFYFRKHSRNKIQDHDR